MSELIMRVEGMDGQVELLNDRVVISRSGIWNIFKYGLNSKREIPLGAISEVSFKSPSLFGMGEIEFIRGGSSNNNAGNKKQANQNMVKFRKKELEKFEALKEKVFDLINQQKKA